MTITQSPCYIFDIVKSVKKGKVNMLKERTSMAENEKTKSAKITDWVPVLKIAICDDEKSTIDSLENLLFHIKGDRNIQVETFLSSPEFFYALEERDEEELPDIVFLDIAMPEMDGIVVGKKIHSISGEIYTVFITAHPEYAVSGYEARAFRYILKPFSEKAISKVLIEITKELSKRKKLMIQGDGKEYMINLRDIIYICAEDKYTIIYTKKQHYIDRMSLNDYEKLLLPYGFYRIHRKYIVNFLHHKGMEKSKVCLTNDISVPISRRREQAYRKELLYSLEKDLI